MAKEMLTANSFWKINCSVGTLLVTELHEHEPKHLQ